MSDQFRSKPYSFGTPKEKRTQHYNFQAPVEEFFVISVLTVTGVCAVIIIAFAL